MKLFRFRRKWLSESSTHGPQLYLGVWLETVAGRGRRGHSSSYNNHFAKLLIVVK